MLLLDTNVVSEMRKVRAGQADPHVARWTRGVETAMLYLSAITIQELELGVLLAERRQAAHAMALRRWLDQQVLPAFADRILPVDAAVARQAARLHVPVPRPLHDALIAATARVHGMLVVTRNLADFAATGVGLLNPWTPP